MSSPAASPLARASLPALAVAAGSSALGFYFSTAASPTGLLAWIAPAPLLALAFGVAGARRRGEAPSGGAKRVVAAAFAAALAGNLSWVALYWGVLPLAGLSALVLLLALAFAVVVALTAFVAARLGTWAGVVVFPSAWVSFELALARLSPHGTAGSVAYSQVDLVPLVQLASWAGLSAITFTVLFFAGGLAATVGDSPGKGLRWRFIVFPTALVAAALAAGQMRVSAATAAGRVLVGLVSVDGGMRFVERTDREQALAILQAYLEAAGGLAARGAEAVVMPEKMLAVTPGYEKEVESRLSSLSESGNVLVVAGLNRITPRGKRNLAAVFARGRRVLAYEKQRPVPGLEAEYGRGTQPGLHRAPGGMTGIAICKDLDFPEIGREYSRAGVGILFVPAWDFDRDARLHSRMAVMRGVEGGFSVARAAANGLLTGSDFLGRIIAERPSGADSRSRLLVGLPLGRGSTFYAEHGDWLAWLAVAVAAGLILLASRYTARL